MSILGNILKTVTGDITGAMKKYASKPLMEGTMAALALVSIANGEVKQEEKKKLLGFIKRDEALKVFKTKDLTDSFEKYIDELEFDKGIGEDTCMQAIRKATDDSDAARLLVRGCIAIAGADGDFDKSEVAVVKKICDALSLPHASFNL